MTTVLAAGTFDHVHKGHEYFLTEARKHGDKLVVVVALDKTVEQRKGKLPKYSQDERVEHVLDVGIADEVVLGKEGSIFDIISEINPDVICLGYDQGVSEDHLQQELDKRGLSARIVRLDSFEPHTYKSSKLKQHL